MFVTRKTLDLILEQKTLEIRNLHYLHCKLWDKHNDLLRHLGLYEVEIPGTTELRKTE